jgi:hypothetical protein
VSATTAKPAVIVQQPVSLATTLWHRSRDHDLTGLSAEMAYRFLFALFPFALFVASVAAFVAAVLGLGDPTGRIVDGLGDNLPPELAGTVRQELEQVLGQQRPGLATVGALIALGTTGPLELTAGSIRSGSLEASNVDLSKEFINMIVASTGFTAASRVISTSDQLLTELLNTTR